VLSQNNVTHWQAIESQEYFCFKSVEWYALLGFEGHDCLNITSKKECGRANLYKSKCSDTYGWRVGFVENNYILQPLNFPDVYLYFNTQDCQPLSKKCGRVVGHFFDKHDIESSPEFVKVYFNIHTIVVSAARHLP
jgi:hypothetical protein